MAPGAVNVIEPPEQNVVGPDGVMTTVGVGFTVSTCVAVAVQPFWLVMVTEYEPAVLTVTVCVVAALLQI